MRCPNPRCHEDDDTVIETRSNHEATSLRRRRRCNACGFRYSTYEKVEGVQVVRKRRGGTEAFDIQKLRRGIEFSLAKLATRDAVAIVLEGVLDEFREEVVDAELLGESVERHLAKVHPIAYLRFASVFRHWTTAEDFRGEVAAML